jgi:two-component system phosphate regulon response regulator PhoB
MHHACQEEKPRLPPRVALIEDDEDLAILLRYNLESAGFVVDWLPNGPDGLVRIFQRPPCLVVLDWMLPGLSGVELARRLRCDQRTRALPILMVTARSDPDDRRWALAAGADVVFSKPFAVSDFMADACALAARSALTEAGVKEAASTDKDDRHGA